VEEEEEVEEGAWEELEGGGRKRGEERRGERKERKERREGEGRKRTLR